MKSLLSVIAIVWLGGAIAEAADIAEAVWYLTQARQVTGEVLHVDGGSHLGHW